MTARRLKHRWTQVEDAILEGTYERLKDRHSRQEIADRILNPPPKVERPKRRRGRPGNIEAGELAVWVAVKARCVMALDDEPRSIVDVAKQLEHDFAELMGIRLRGVEHMYDRVQSRVDQDAELKAELLNFVVNAGQLAVEHHGILMPVTWIRRAGRYEHTWDRESFATTLQGEVRSELVTVFVLVPKRRGK